MHRQLVFIIEVDTHQNVMFEIYRPEHDGRPRGITAIASIMLGYALAASIFAVLIATGSIAMARGAWLIGGGFEVLGPGAFALFAALHFACGAGLLKLNRWALRFTSILLLFELIQVTPAISSAVADSRILATAREGLQILWRSAALWYLWQESVRDTFTRHA